VVLMCWNRVVTAVSIPIVVGRVKNKDFSFISSTGLAVQYLHRAHLHMIYLHKISQGALGVSD
jgi:hypothetical protein